MEQIYTIPVNEAFEKVQEEGFCTCPFCLMYNRLDDNELDLILGASMMEPDVRQKNSHQQIRSSHCAVRGVYARSLGGATCKNQTRCRDARPDSP